MDKHVELHPGYLVKVDGQIGRILAVHINSAVVQLSNHKETFIREAIEVLEATPYSDIKTYKAGEFQKCEDCGKPKPIEEFSRLKGGTRRKQCKECFGNRIRNGRNKKYAPKPFEFSTPRKEPEIKMIEPVKEIKTVEEWVEKNLNKENSAVVKPKHYVGTNGLEVKQVLEEFVKDKTGIVAHRWCSAVEYLLRAYEKNGKEDLEKAKMNIEWLIEEAE